MSILILLSALCIGSCIAIACLGMVGGGGTSEEVVADREARRQERLAATASVTQLPTQDTQAAPARVDAAA